MKRFVIIDGHAILHRAYHALPPLTSKDGKPTNAVYGFMSMLLKVIHDLQPTHVAVVFDRPGGTFRNELYKDYQSNRPKADDNFIVQIDTVHELLDILHIPFFEKDGYEADDVIGTIAKKVKNKEEVIIVTSDRDQLQLVNGHVKLFMPVKGLTEGKLYGEKEAKERMGVDPAHIIDYKGLAGDPSDNFPGVGGIGPKTAISLIEQFDSVENVYKHLDKVKSATVRQKLEMGRASALMSKKLATIVTDASVSFKLESCALPDLVRPEVVEYLNNLGFKSLVKRITGKDTTKRAVKIEKVAEPKKEEQLGLL